MKTEDITPLVLTFNEAPNIARALDRLGWARQIIVLDSLSTDGTCDLVRKDPRVRLVQRAFDNHTDQWNHGVAQVGTEWVLSLDADYVVPARFAEEIAALDSEGVSAYFARFRYCIAGNPLRSSLYPPRAVLFRKSRCRYRDDGHTQLLEVDGRTGFLRTQIDHDDRKSFSRWLEEQDRYAQREATKLSGGNGVTGGGNGLEFADRIRTKMVLAPAMVFFYTLFWKGLILDGWPGWYYVMQRTVAEMILSMKLIEEKMGKSRK